MKQFKTIILSMLLAVVAFSSCEKMLYVESDRYLYAENNRLDSPNDSVYSLVGILNKFQLLGDQYVLLGELRAELMDVTHNATQDLIELNNLDYSNPENPYLNLSNYYAVINHCNYLIQTMDTSIVVQGEQRLLREVAAAKAIRAWTYLQMALNFNGAYYYEQPILTVAESQAIASDKATYFKDKDAILQLLVEDLLPVLNVPMPTYSLAVDNATKYLPSIPYLLGEIYLWQNRYQEAADMYYLDIVNNKRLVTNVNSSTLEDLGQSVVIEDAYSNSYVNGYFVTGFWYFARDASAVIPYYTDNKFGRFNVSKMYRYTYTDYCVAPSAYAFDWFKSQPYLHQGENLQGEPVNIASTGDLRGHPNSMMYTRLNLNNLEGLTQEEIKMYEQIQIYKEPIGTLYITESDIVYQHTALAYLRYAEAINRAGKPSVALAVINNGLNQKVLNDSLIIRPADLDTVFSAKWSDIAFMDNVGTRTRGQGPSTRVNFFFETENPTEEDYILFVEQVLVDECGLESAFHGNRFHDLLRFTQHDGAPNYIGNALAKKHPERAAEFKAKGKDDWYIPYPTTQE